MTREERLNRRHRTSTPPPSVPLNKAEQAERVAAELPRISEGSLVIQITDRSLAIFLASVGVPMKENPPFKHIELTTGEEKWIFNFADRTLDGTSTRSLVEAYQNREQHLGQDTAVSGALAVLANLEKFTEIEARSKPWRGYYHKSKPTLTTWAKRGSEREARLIEKNYKRVNPTKPNEAPKT